MQSRFKEGFKEVPLIIHKQNFGGNMRIMLMVATVLILVAGLYAAGTYVDNGNGTVTDTKTGLVWQKCSAGQKNDLKCSYDKRLVNRFSWADAIEYCFASPKREFFRVELSG